MAAALTEPELAKAVASAVNCAKDAEAGDSAEEKRAVDTLKYLSKLVVTAELLKNTDAGKKVNKLKKHSSAKIVEAALNVIDAWKTCVRQESAKEKPAAKAVQAQDKSKSSEKPSIDGAGAKSKVRSNNGGGPAAIKPTAAAAAAAAAAVLEKKPSGGAKPTYKKPQSTGNDPRFKIREVIADALAQALDSVDIPDPDPWKVAVAVEEALFKQNGGGMTSEYKAKFRSISFNLKDQGNPWLRRSVLDGSIAPEQLAGMTSEEMASEERRKENEKIREEMTKEAVRGNNQQASTDMFQCGRCKQRKCTYFQMQTRSADEPMTTFVTCIVCGNKWKFC